MSADSRKELQLFAQTIVGAFLLSLDERSPGSAQALTDSAREFLASERCAALIDTVTRSLAQVMATQQAQERRSDPFRRLLCHPLTELFDQGTLSRALLPDYFTFLHLVLGDTQDELTAECHEIIGEIQNDPDYSWDMFYDDIRAKKILWRVLMRISETFKRFEPRRDWFIGLMQNTPHAVSLASNSFMPLPRDADDTPTPFGVAEFNLLFAALFRPLLSLAPRDEAAFTQLFRAPPARLVLPLVEKLK